MPPKKKKSVSGPPHAEKGAARHFLEANYSLNVEFDTGSQGLQKGHVLLLNLEKVCTMHKQLTPGCLSGYLLSDWHRPQAHLLVGMKKIKVNGTKSNMSAQWPC